jgi:histidinol dehydrogenase
VEDIATTIESWEAQKQNDLRKLAVLIKKIINLVKECGGNAVLKYTVEGDKLVLSKFERKEMLPKDLYSKWDNMYNPHKETKSPNDDIQEPEIDQTGQESMSTVSYIRNGEYSANVEAFADGYHGK